MHNTQNKSGRVCPTLAAGTTQANAHWSPVTITDIQAQGFDDLPAAQATQAAAQCGEYPSGGMQPIAAPANGTPSAGVEVQP